MQISQHPDYAFLQIYERRYHYLEDCLMNVKPKQWKELEIKYGISSKLLESWYHNTICTVIIRNSWLRASVMYSLVKTLPLKNESPSLDPQHPQKNPWACEAEAPLTWRRPTLTRSHGAHALLLSIHWESSWHRDGLFISYANVINLLPAKPWWPWSNSDFGGMCGQRV